MKSYGTAIEVREVSQVSLCDWYKSARYKLCRTNLHVACKFLVHYLFTFSIMKLSWSKFTFPRKIYTFPNRFIYEIFVITIRINFTRRIFDFWNCGCNSLLCFWPKFDGLLRLNSIHKFDIFRLFALQLRCYPSPSERTILRHHFVQKRRSSTLGLLGYWF